MIESRKEKAAVETISSLSEKARAQEPAPGVARKEAPASDRSPVLVPSAEQALRRVVTRYRTWGTRHLL
jgi:hypothetical protein